MEKCKHRLSTSFFMLIEKLVPLYLEHIAQRKLRDKLSLSGLINWTLVLLLTTVVLAIASWGILMGLAFSYLQAADVPIIRILLIMLALNIGLLLITLIGVAKIKKKAVDSSL